MAYPRCYVDGKTIRGKYRLQEVGSSGVLQPVCMAHKDSPLPVPIGDILLSPKGVETLMLKEREREKRELRGPFRRPQWAYD
jgi:hypothetical protein